VDDIHRDAVLHDSHDEDHFHLARRATPGRLRPGLRPRSTATSRSSPKPCTASSTKTPASPSSTTSRPRRP
jgi:hypothetical protein